MLLLQTHNFIVSPRQFLICNVFRCLRVLPQVYGGMRGMKGLVYETSVLDPDEVSILQKWHSVL